MVAQLMELRMKCLESTVDDKTENFNFTDNYKLVHSMMVLRYWTAHPKLDVYYALAIFLNTTA